eukprot:318247_1
MQIKQFYRAPKYTIQLLKSSTIKRLLTTSNAIYVVQCVSRPTELYQQSNAYYHNKMWNFNDAETWYRVENVPKPKSLLPRHENDFFELENFNDYTQFSNPSINYQDMSWLTAAFFTFGGVMLWMYDVQIVTKIKSPDLVDDILFECGRLG